MQIRQPTSGDAISAEIRTCLRRGLAQIVSGGQAVAATSLVLHQPSRLAPAALPRLTEPWQEVSVVCHQIEDLAAARTLSLPSRTRIRTFALNAALRALSPWPIAHRDWLPAIAEAGLSRQPRRVGAFALGWLDIAGLDDADIRAVLDHHDLRAAARHFALGDIGQALGIAPLPALSLDRSVAGLDAMVVAPLPGCRDLPGTLISSGLQAGLPVLMPDRLQPDYGSGPAFFLSPKPSSAFCAR